MNTLDLRTGRRYDVLPVREGETEAELRVPPRIRELGLNADGSGGWLQSFRGRRELFAFDRNGADRLAVSEGHDLRFLRVRGGRLQWRQGGKPPAYRLDRWRRCGLRGSSTLLRTEESRAWIAGEWVWACHVARNRRVELGYIRCELDYCGTNRLRLAGEFAAFDTGHVGRGAPEVRLHLVDLRRGRRPFFHSDSGAVTALELHSSGELAWIQSTYAPGRSGYEVRTRRRGLLDVVEYEDATSLTLEGDTLRWTSRGEPRAISLR